MRDLEKEILLAVKEFDRSKKSLINQFGLQSIDIIDLLKEKGFLEFIFGTGFTVFVDTIKITKLGILYLDGEFCPVCECTPCDCNWGYDEY
jgi:hypothetical protein